MADPLFLTYCNCARISRELQPVKLIQAHVLTFSASGPFLAPQFPVTSYLDNSVALGSVGKNVALSINFVYCLRKRGR